MLRPLSPEHGDDETFEGLLILRPEGRLFFVDAQAVGQRIQALVAEHQPRVLVLDMSRVSTSSVAVRDGYALLWRSSQLRICVMLPVASATLVSAAP